MDSVPNFHEQISETHGHAISAAIGAIIRQYINKITLSPAAASSSELSLSDSEGGRSPTAPCRLITDWSGVLLSSSSSSLSSRCRHVQQTEIYVKTKRSTHHNNDISNNNSSNNKQYLENTIIIILKIIIIM